MVAAGQKALSAMLPRDIHTAIWRRLANRLQHGEVLITTGDYMRVLESEYAALTGAPATPNVVGVLRQAIETYNDRHPEAYVARGVVNCVSKAFRTGARRLEWDAIKIRLAGPPSIVRFTRRERVRSFLEDVCVPTDRIDPRECIRTALTETSPRSIPLTRDKSSPVILSDDVRLALRAGLLEQGQINGRLNTQRRRRAVLRDAEERKVPSRIEVLVELGRLSAEDGRTIQELQQLDRDVAPDEADATATGALELLAPAERKLLNAKIREAIEYDVGYLDIFTSLQRIGTEFDEALAFLVGRETDGSCEEIATELAGRGKIIDQLNMLADRVDDEVGMLAVGLPPYDNPELNMDAGTGQDDAVSFVKSFRESGLDDISDQLCSPGHEGVRPVAAMNRLVSVLRRLTKPTPLRLEVRALKVRQKVEDLFRSGDEPKVLRQEAQSIFSMRLRRMFPDLAAEEQSAIESRAMELIDGVEAAIAEERRMRRSPAPETAVSSPDNEIEAPTAVEGSLTPEEMQQGALIGRVETRIAGDIRAIPQVIMVDPDHPDHFVVARRDENGKLVPALRHGSRNRVRKARDGSWRIVS